jgi:dCMP deaminase
MLIIMKNSKRSRPSWDELFMSFALSSATRSSCIYLQTGAVIVKDNRIISEGYNGAPPGIENCLERGCRKDREKVSFNDKGKGVCRGIHAEINAISQILKLKSNLDLIGTSLYTWYYPCSRCAKEIVSSGIVKEVIYSRVYKEPDSLTKEIFEEAGIGLRKFDLDIERYLGMMRKIYNS